MKPCEEVRVDKRVIRCQWKTHWLSAVIEDGKLKYTTYRDAEIRFNEPLPSVYISDINSKTIDTLLGFLVAIKFALEE